MVFENFTESVRNLRMAMHFCGEIVDRSSSRIGLNRNGKSPSIRMMYIEHFLDGDGMKSKICIVITT